MPGAARTRGNVAFASQTRGRVSVWRGFCLAGHGVFRVCLHYGAVVAAVRCGRLVRSLAPTGFADGRTPRVLFAGAGKGLGAGGSCGCRRGSGPSLSSSSQVSERFARLCRRSLAGDNRRRECMKLFTCLGALVGVPWSLMGGGGGCVEAAAGSSKSLKACL